MNKAEEIRRINACISDLVYDKVQLRKAYNYYHCKRDAEQFRSIEENYGIGTPTSVGFTPLIKKHIDVLVGEYLELDPDLQVSCKDDATVTNIMRDKQLKIHAEAFKFFKQRLESAIIQIFLEGKHKFDDPYFEQEIARIKKDVEKSYVSEYEMAAQNILNYIKHSRDIDLKNKMRELLTDLLIGGMCYFRTKPSGSKTGLELEILNPIDTFIERNHNEYFLNKSPRAVIRRYLTKDQIKKEFYDELSSEAKAKLNDSGPDELNASNSIYIQVHTMDPIPATPSNSGLLGGLEITPIRDAQNGYYHSNDNLICVYDCEWIEYNDKEDKLERHEGIKIGEEIYITRGVSEYITRSVTEPKDCSLSINGIFFSDKNGDPFSLMLNTMNLQDRYDLTIYYRDSLVASSGTVGDWLDAASLPDFLGEEMEERAQKWLAYKKQGIAWYNSSQDGAQLLNTTFNGYDDTVKAQCIQAFQMVLESIENQASSITGVFAEKLGGIQQRDAVSNVKVGIRQSTLLTKQYFNAMDMIYKEVNYDLLNLAKIVYKNGIAGELINGTVLNRVFTALPEYYTMTDFDIHIQDSSETFQNKENLKATSVELIKSGQIDPTMVFNIMMAKNVTELRHYINDAVASKKKENDAVKQLQEQLQQLQEQAKQIQQQAQQLQTENDKLKKEVEKRNQAQLAIDQKRVSIEEQNSRNTKEYNDKLAEIKAKELEIEVMQLNDSNPYNDKIAS
jgi:hypothetical protein